MSLSVGTSVNQPLQYWDNTASVNRSNENFGNSFMGKATSHTTSSNAGKNIGIMTIGNQGYIAKYADSSTDAEPIIKVGNYEVRVNDVDPRNATEIEMFALTSYMDDKGITNNTGMKSFNKMRAYSQQAEYNGFCSGIAGSESAWTQSRDWISILGNAKESYFAIPQAYHQGLKCQSIIDGLVRWSEAEYNNDRDKSIGDYSYEEWERLLDGVDQKIADMKAATTETVRESKGLTDEHIGIEKADMLTARYTTYETGSTLTDPDTGKDVTFRYVYRTFYTREGIVSGVSSYDSREGEIKDVLRWRLDFKSDGDYEKVMSFLDRVPEDDYTKFLTKENFWQDFLDGEIDEDEFFEFYETLDHGRVKLKADENGNNFIDEEMMRAKYFKYIAMEQLRPVSEPELMRGLELSALKDRGYDHSADYNNEDTDLFASLREALSNNGNEDVRFYGAEDVYSIDDWIQEIIRRTHMGMMDSLFA